MDRFSDLPAEVRNMVYEDLLWPENMSHACKPHKIAIFSVSKRIHHEASSYFYEHGDIAIHAPSKPTEASTLTPPIADKYLRFLRRLDIHLWAGQANSSRTQNVAASLARLATMGSRLTRLRMFITSPLSHLLNSRVDDSIMDGEHPIVMSLQALLDNNSGTTMEIHLKGTWLAPGVASALLTAFGARITFFTNGAATADPSALERPLTGRFSSTHLSTFGLSEQDVADPTWQTPQSQSTTPLSLASSLGSAFAALDTFSVSSFGSNTNPDSNSESDPDLFSPTSKAQHDNTPFFTTSEIDEWSTSLEPMSPRSENEEEILGVLDDLDVDADTDMEDVSQAEVDALFQNMEDVSHHAANAADVEYMTNFAPDLLLKTGGLGHLI